LSLVPLLPAAADQNICENIIAFIIWLPALGCPPGPVWPPNIPPFCVSKSHGKMSLFMNIYIGLKKASVGTTSSIQATTITNIATFMIEILENY